MSWPEVLKNDIRYEKHKAIYDLIESDSYFSRIDARAGYRSENGDWNKRTHYLDCFMIYDKADDVHYFSIYRNEITCSFRRMTKNGNSTRSHHEKISIDDANLAIQKIKEIITLSRQADEFKKRQESKREQMNSITSIIIDGLGARYPKVKAALDAKHRGSRNFLDHEFKKNRLIFHAKLTIEDRTKLEKLFQVLEEIV